MGEAMSDTESRWLTYEELGQIIGRTPSGARMFAARRGWPKRTSNRIGERTSVLVPTEIAEAPARAAHDKNGAMLANGSGERAMARAAIDALAEQLAITNRRLDEERTSGARAIERAALEIADVRQQRDDAQRRADRAEQRVEELQAALAARRRWWRFGR